jgi:hypothetical protein
MRPAWSNYNVRLKPPCELGDGSEGTKILARDDLKEAVGMAAWRMGAQKW